MSSKTLLEDFNARRDWKNNRSSAIYPLDIKNNSDFVISFLNYWKIKNNLNEIELNISLFNQNGKVLKKKKIKIIYKHYHLSLSKIFRIKNFKGIVQLEFYSKENVRYPFPAITGFFISPNKHISGVHSAGRILNDNELKKKINYEESNFTLKYKKGLITPFFSYFNSSKKKKKKIIVSLKTVNNKLIKKIILKKELEKPYQNKIFYLDEYFNEDNLKKSYLATINVTESEIFPRLICGNYHRDIHHYELTHSYGVIKNKKDLIKDSYLNNNKVKHMSLMPFIKPKELNLKLKIFPTCLKSKLLAKEYSFNENTKKLEFKNESLIEPSKKGTEFVIEEETKHGFFSIKQKKIPSRLNASYIYSYNDANSLSTDIAAGFRTIDYPVKKNHWGSIWLSKTIKSKILIRKNTFLIDDSITTGTLNIYGHNKLIKSIKINLKNDNYKIIDINKLINNKKENIKSYGWIFNVKKNPLGIEIFWLSYNKKFICGEHGF